MKKFADFSIVFCILTVLSFALPNNASSQDCSSDIECDDGIPCTTDICQQILPIAPGVCLHIGPDLDLDGHCDINCLMFPPCDDCDDNDINRFPGNLEVCDPNHHDEDCNPNTAGGEDNDLDHFLDSSCCNTNDGELICSGNDCDDNNPAIHPGVMVCSGDDPTMTKICNSVGEFEDAACLFEGNICITQPNGTAVCVPKKVREKKK